MYDIRQFRPTLYVLILLGFTGFAVAAESPGVWVLATGALLLNAWLVHRGKFTPLPRWLANLVTVLALLYVAERVAAAPAAPILVIGQFLVLLQVVKIYEQRANRDYAQLLVLSLLLMVAASISTASLIFGVMLIGYLFLSLYCCLLFHLKVESEAAREALSDTQQKLNPATLKQDQRYLTRSMRRLTGLVSSVAVGSAVLVFLFFPRGTGGNLIPPLRLKPAAPLTGFSDQVSFQQVARITQSNEEVAKVMVTRNGQPVDGTQMLMLRGIALDVYGGASPDSPAGAWRWMRSPRLADAAAVTVPPRSPYQLDPSAPEVWQQRISLKPTGTRVLFAMAGPTTLVPGRELNLVYSPDDQVIESREPLYSPLDYTVISSGVLKKPEPQPGPPADSSGSGAPGPDAAAAAAAAAAAEAGIPLKSSIDPKVLAYAMRPEVCGKDAKGTPLAKLRPRTGGPNKLDEQIATNIAHHLQTTFTYTLDLTDAAHIIQGQDPLVAFLYDLKRGHCEYFAGAMTLMCQSLGMQARMVVGFKCDDYNSLGHYYQVRQSQAHAWVEVLLPDGTWKTFDPTSSQDTRITTKPTLLTELKHFFNFLEFKWAEHVVAYDNETRDNLIQNVETRMNTTATRTTDRFSSFKQWLTDAATVLSISSQVLAGLIVLAILGIFVAIGYFVFERWRLRRRAARIGLDGLPQSDQLRLARQLKFYADLMVLLERRNIRRPRHLTPLEFAHSLSFLPADIYDSIQELTSVFYSIRFGRHHLPAEEHRRLAGMTSEVDHRLPQFL